MFTGESHILLGLQKWQFLDLCALIPFSKSRIKLGGLYHSAYRCEKCLILYECTVASQESCPGTIPVISETSIENHADLLIVIFGSAVSRTSASMQSSNLNESDNHSECFALN